jgi:large subunit ribosomal protein L31
MMTAKALISLRLEARRERGTEGGGSAVYLWFLGPPEEFAVKPGIHPKYQEVNVRCACGNTFTTRSTKSDLHLDICNACHPFFTGRQKLIDTEGRVERFTKRFGTQTAAARKEATKATKAAKATKSKKTSASA